MCYMFVNFDTDSANAVKVETGLASTSHRMGIPVSVVTNKQDKPGLHPGVINPADMHSQEGMFDSFIAC